MVNSPHLPSPLVELSRSRARARSTRSSAKRPTTIYYSPVPCSPSHCLSRSRSRSRSRTSNDSLRPVQTAPSTYHHNQNQDKSKSKRKPVNFVKGANDKFREPGVINGLTKRGKQEMRTDFVDSGGTTRVQITRIPKKNDGETGRIVDNKGREVRGLRNGLKTRLKNCIDKLL